MFTATQDIKIFFTFLLLLVFFSLSYSPIRLLEVCVPFPKIFIKRQAPLKVSLLQDLKDFFQKVSQVYLAVDERLASLKTDTFSKTREEKMEDIFAQKEVIHFFDRSSKVNY